ncbi:hypothetical protein EYS14_19045 [Alteromonadaceae bacterium M269]|nr:hypothetical protein EYS14_19045 [Alteromonadaceae bacterium M269]
MHIYSEDYFLLKTLSLQSYCPTYKLEQSHSFEHIQEAKVIATLLANSELATPRLNQETIRAFLNSELGWPMANGEEYFYTEEISITFDQLEELGCVSYYAGWLRIHFRSPRQLDDMHESVKPLNDMLQLLRSLRWGNERFVKPYFKLPIKLAKELLAPLTPAQYLDDLECARIEGEYLALNLDANSYDDYLSFYLWRELIKLKRPEEAFKHWLDVLMVYCGYLPAPKIELLSIEERQKFESSFFEYLSSDTELNTSWSIIHNRYIMENHIDRWLTERNEVIHLDINVYSDMTETPTYSRRLRAMSLDDIKHNLSKAQPKDQNLRERISWCKASGNYSDFFFTTPYESLLLAYIEWTLRIEPRFFSASEALENLFHLRCNRPVLENIIFYSLLKYSKTPDFSIYLLARPETSTIGADWLINEFHHIKNRNETREVLVDIEKEYKKLIAKNVLIHMKNPDEVLFDDIAWLMRNNSQKHVSNQERSLNRPENFIQYFLEEISIEQINSILPALHKYFALGELKRFIFEGDLYLIFKLLKKLKDEGISDTSSIVTGLQAVAVEIVKSVFDSVAEQRQDLYLSPNGLTAKQPWHLLNNENSLSLLGILPQPKVIHSSLQTDSGRGFSYQDCSRYRSAILFILQPLIGLIPQEIPEIKRTLLQVIELCGFTLSEGNKESYLCLFEEPLDKYDFDLWVEVCRNANHFSEEEFQRLLNVIDDSVSIRRILELYKHTQQSNRKRDIRKKIDRKLFRDVTDEGLHNLEQAFLISVNNNISELTKELVNSAQHFISNRLSQFPNNNHFKTYYDQWQLYGYKFSLIEISETAELSIEQKKSKINGYPQPELKALGYLSGNINKEAEQFKRYVIAVLLIDIEPSKSSQILEQLIKENPVKGYIDNWFAASLTKLEREEADLNAYRKVLMEYKRKFPSFSSSNLSLQGTQNYLSCLLKLREFLEIEACWLSLGQDKKNSISIVTVYCRKLKESGDIVKARQMYKDFLNNFHGGQESSVEQQSLLKELDDAIASEVEPKALAIAAKSIALESRSNDELRHYFQEIKSLSPDSISQIVSGKTLKQFLFDNVVAVCRELLKRVASLREPDKKEGNSRITKEDNINNWFTSVFDNRLCVWGIRCEGQKQLGDSPNIETTNPGELDGYFASAAGQGIAIFEAFRLFSLDTTVITEHLNKLAGYNPEGLSPIFILIYSQVIDFNALCSKYKSLIEEQEYTNFSAPINKNEELDRNRSSGRLFTFSETRGYRSQEITFYHCLLDLS